MRLFLNIYRYLLTKYIIVYNTLQQITSTYKNRLQSIYDENEIRNFVTILALYELGYTKIDCMMNASNELNKSDADFFKHSLEKLEQNIPIQQITGETEFYGLPFKVSKDVLIPRPETEELVEWILKDNTNKHINILDIGTGSGCIPITLKQHLPDAKVTSWDISENALEIANHNAMINNTEVAFEHQDVLKFDGALPNQLDIVVSNPPYIRELEKEWMHDNVLDHEPHLALFVSDSDPLIFYRKIAQLAKANLKSGGALYFEINEALGKEMIDLLNNLGFNNVELRKDLFGKDRMLKGIA